jgi:hypothetical protein
MTTAPEVYTWWQFALAALIWAGLFAAAFAIDRLDAERRRNEEDDRR